MQATETQDFTTAAHTLMTASDTSLSRAALARMLGEVIDRQLWINGGSLPDRPDALIEAVGDNPAQARPADPSCWAPSNVGTFL